MENRQLNCYNIDVKDKIIVCFGDEWEYSTLLDVKEKLTKKGTPPLGMIIMPDIHHAMISADKNELIEALKKTIEKLEAL